MKKVVTSLGSRRGLLAIHCKPCSLSIIVINTRNPCVPHKIEYEHYGSGYPIRPKWVFWIQLISTYPSEENKNASDTQIVQRPSTEEKLGSIKRV